MTTLWIIWIAGFFILEGYAIFKHVKGGTLTAHFYRWFSLAHHGKLYWARRATLALFIVWLAWHFFA